MLKLRSGLLSGTEADIERCLTSGDYASLDRFEGGFSGAYEHDGRTILFRDRLGLWPLWYVIDADGLRYAWRKDDLAGAVELDPRRVFVFDSHAKFIERPFFTDKPVLRDSETKIRDRVRELLYAAVKRRARGRIGLLFSGGVDSTYLAQLLKRAGLAFKCYTVSTDRGLDGPAACHAAEQLALDIELIEPTTSDITDALRQTARIISDDSPVKAGVGATELIALEAARRDGVTTVFGGLGSEELFAGYERHGHVADINAECVAGLRGMHERDLYRDWALADHLKISFTTPFLDTALIEYSLRIPAALKIRDGQKKWILRAAAEADGVPAEFAWRPKKAAQYGSGVDRELEQLAKADGQSGKREFIKRLRG